MQTKLLASLLALTAIAALGCAQNGADAADSNATETTFADSTAAADDTTALTETASSATGSDDTVVDSSGSGSEVVCDGDGARPSPRSEMEAVWDAAGGRMVFFGGDQGFPVMCMSQTDFVAQTWAFRPDCDEFDQIETDVAPSARGRYAMAHDAVGQRMVIHGGRFRDGTMGTYTLFDDTWIFDLTTDTWTEVDATGPSARTNHTAVVLGNELLVYGGNASDNGLAFTPLADLWSLDLATQTWTELSPDAPPGSRLFHAAAASSDGTTMFIYGGGDENAFVGPFFGDLWGYDRTADAWAMLDDGSGGPVGSIWGDLLFDAQTQRLLLWGAHEDNLLGNNNKIWSYAFDAGWTRIEEGDVQLADPAGFCDFPVDFVDPDLDAPERRSGGAAVLTDDGELLVFGGKTDCGISDDVWGWSLSREAWTNRVAATAGEICVRAFAEGCETMCF